MQLFVKLNKSITSVDVINDVVGTLEINDIKICLPRTLQQSDFPWSYLEHEFRDRN